MCTSLDFLDVVDLPNGPFVYCRPCTSIVAANRQPIRSHHGLASKQSRLYRHLDQHHDLASPRQIPDWVAARPRLAEALANSRDQYPAPLPDQSPPFPGLQVFDRMECILCAGPEVFRSMGEDSMRKHCRKSHGAGGVARPGATYRRVPAQTWFPRWEGGAGVWWLVTLPRKRKRVQQTPEPPPLARRPLPRRREPIPDLHTERHLVGTHSRDDYNPYVGQAGWYELFRKLPYRHALRQATYLPVASTSHQLTDERATNGELIDAHFPIEAEGTLGVLLAHQQLLFTRCKATLDTTPHYLRSWLMAESRAKPYKDAFAWLPNQASLSRYLGHWKRLLSLLFRAHQLECRHHPDILGATSWVTADQRSQMCELWKLARIVYDRESGSPLCDPDDPVLKDLQSIHSSPEQELIEGLMQLNISLFTTPIETWSTTTHHLLIFYAGVLSLDLGTGAAAECRFIPIAQSTPILSSLVWIGRLFVLEHALPQRPYHRPRWPARTSYKDALARFHEVQAGSLVTDCNSAFRELFRLRSIGRRLRHQDIGRTLLYWSEDDEVVTVGEQPLRMAHFRDWVAHVLATAQSPASRPTRRWFDREPPRDPYLVGVD